MALSLIFKNDVFRLAGVKLQVRYCLYDLGSENKLLNNLCFFMPDRFGVTLQYDFNIRLFSSRSFW